MTVTGALASPSHKSGRACGAISSGIGTEPCASWACAGKGASTAGPSAAASTTVAAPWQNSRRLIGNLQLLGVGPPCDRAFA